MTVTIRRAQPADAAVLAGVAAATFPLACPPHTTEDAQAEFIRTVLSEERFAEYLADTSRVLLIAEDSASGAIGYTMVNLGEPADEDVRAAIRIRPTSELSKCYVLPGHHGAGVARELMAVSLEAAAEAGASRHVARRQRGERAGAALLRQERLRARRVRSASWSGTAWRTTG